MTPANTPHSNSTPLEVPIMMDWGADGFMAGAEQPVNNSGAGVSMRLILCFARFHFFFWQ